MTTQSAKQYDNSNSGALFANGGDKLQPILKGTWQNAAGHKFGLAISADVDGERTIVQLASTGNVAAQGTVSSVPSKPGKSVPAYRGTLGKLHIVLWDMGSYYQVRIDAGSPTPTLSDEAAKLLGL